jgi:hypothetical protein
LVGFRSSWMAKGNPMWSSELRMWPLPLCPSSAATGWQEQSNGAAWVSPVLPSSSPADFRFPNFAAEFTGVRKTWILSSQTEAKLTARNCATQPAIARARKGRERRDKGSEYTRRKKTERREDKICPNWKKRWQEPHPRLAVTPPNRWQRLPGPEKNYFRFFFFGEQLGLHSSILRTQGQSFFGWLFLYSQIYIYIYIYISCARIKCFLRFSLAIIRPNFKWQKDLPRRKVIFLLFWGKEKRLHSSIDRTPDPVFVFGWLYNNNNNNNSSNLLKLLRSKYLYEIFNSHNSKKN